MRLFSGVAERLRESFARTRESLEDGLARIFSGRELDSGTVEALEEILLQADLGLATAEEFVVAVCDDARRGQLTGDDVRQALAAHLRQALKGADAALDLDARPAVVVFPDPLTPTTSTTAGRASRSSAASAPLRA